MLPGLTRTLLMTGAVARRVIFLTAGATWTVPGDWTPTNNKIEVLGGGGGGARTTGGTLEAGGGGGAAYAALANVALTPGAVLNMQVGAGGVGANAGNSYTNTDGTDTWLRIDGGSGAPTTTAQGVLAKAGLKGAVAAGGAGGLASGSVGTNKNNGGPGGTGISSYVSGTGGGGSGGPHGPGAIGGKMTNAGNTGCGGGGGANGGQIGGPGSATNGGAGGNNRLGVGSGVGQTSAVNSSAGNNGGGGGGGLLSGAVNPGQGRDGSQDGIWTQTSNGATAGPGAGGGGGVGTVYIGGNGGLYGGGGAGGGFSGGGASIAGDGARGIIVVTYGGALMIASPAVPVVQTTATGTDSVAGLTRTANLPAGIVPGDTLLLFCASGSAGGATVPGWTSISDFFFATRLTILWRVADGTEGATLTLTTPQSLTIGWQIYRISGAVAAAPQVNPTGAGATTTNPDPPPLTVSPQQPDGADNVLWIAAAHHQNNGTTTAPAGWSGFLNTVVTAGTRQVSSAVLSSKAVGVDPPVFTNAGANNWSAQTVAVVAR